MTLAGDEDDVLRPGLGDGCVNGFATPAYFARLRRTVFPTNYRNQLLKILKPPTTETNY